MKRDESAFDMRLEPQIRNRVTATDNRRRFREASAAD